MAPLNVFAGRANPALAATIARALGTSLGACSTEHFPDGEVHLEIKETVRDHDVFLIQPTCPPVADHLLELLLMADACRRADAGSITAVMPYFGYARQDRRASGREPIGAKLVADLIGATDIRRVVAVDLHGAASEAFFSMPVEHLSAAALLAAAIAPASENAVLVAPDLGAVRLVETYARILNRPMATVHKIRTGPSAVRVRELVGDVRGRRPIIVDDMISTGHTVAAAVRALLAAGCEPDITVVVSHGLFVGDAPALLSGLPISRIITTDSVSQRLELPLPVRIVSLGPLLVDVVRRLHGSESLSDLLVHR